MRESGGVGGGDATLPLRHGGSMPPKTQRESDSGSLITTLDAKWQDKETQFFNQQPPQQFYYCYIIWTCNKYSDVKMSFT